MSDPSANEINSIRNYVEIEDSGCVVTQIQRVAKTKIMGVPHEVWDVWTTERRWWVITNLTNLYNQEQWPSYNMALTYHVGLRVVLSERSRKDIPEDNRSLVPVAWRKYNQAIDTFNASDEAEGFQAVGIHCREALISLAHHFAEMGVGHDLETKPKRASFKEWATLAGEHFATGRLRAYLKSISDHSWDLSVSLQHYSEATSWDAEIVLDATAHLISSFSMAMHRHETGPPERCQSCGSYRVAEDHQRVGESEWEWWSVCSSCGATWNRRTV